MFVCPDMFQTGTLARIDRGVYEQQFLKDGTSKCLFCWKRHTVNIRVCAFWTPGQGWRFLAASANVLVTEATADIRQRLTQLAELTGCRQASAPGAEQLSIYLLGRVCSRRLQVRLTTDFRHYFHAGLCQSDVCLLCSLTCARPICNTHVSGPRTK
jgi:hypothetical protein